MGAARARHENNEEPRVVSKKNSAGALGPHKDPRAHTMAAGELFWALHAPFWTTSQYQFVHSTPMCPTKYAGVQKRHPPVFPCFRSTAAAWEHWTSLPSFLPITWLFSTRFPPLLPETTLYFTNCAKTCLAVVRQHNSRGDWMSCSCVKGNVYLSSL